MPLARRAARGTFRPMTDLLGILALGFVLGMRHATDPDHVIAITTIVARQRGSRGAAWIGAAWGVGHSLTILIVGGGIILFRWVIPERLGISMELAVGVMLVLLGVLTLRDYFRVLPPAGHSHAHAHGDYVHTHPHGHDPEAHPHGADATPVGWLDRRLGGLRGYQLARPLVVGVVHGLAGSAAVALLVVTTIGNPRWSLFYLFMFALGTIGGMALITSALTLPFAYGERVSVRVTGGLRVASGALSLGFGLFMVWRLGQLL
jgi:ABC-type nickel/cobalt efflux system permease component RcnA